MARVVSWRYRRWMRRYAGMRALQVWYAAIPIESIIERVEAARAVPAWRSRDRDLDGRGPPQGPHGGAREAVDPGAWRRLAHPRSPAPAPAAGRRRPGPRVPWRISGPAISGRSPRIAASSSRSTACSTSRSRSSGSAASARAATSRCSPDRPVARSSSRSRRRANRSSRRTSAAGAGATRASASSPASGSCRPSRTASSAGRGRR